MCAIVLQISAVNLPSVDTMISLVDGLNPPKLLLVSANSVPLTNVILGVSFNFNLPQAYSTKLLIHFDFESDCSVIGSY